MGVSGGEDVDGFHSGPVGDLDVAVIGTSASGGGGSRRVLVVPDVPCDASAEDGLTPRSSPPYPEQRDPMTGSWSLIRNGGREVVDGGQERGDPVGLRLVAAEQPR